MSIVIAPLITESGGLVIGPLFVPDDTDAAQFTAGPAVSLISQTGFRVGFTVGEAATVYGIVVAQGSAVPTPEQIIAGVDYGAVTVLDVRQVSVAAGVANQLTFADIDGYEGQNVRAYLTAVDTAGNIQQQADILTALAQLLPAVTPDTTAPVITLAGANPLTVIVGTAYSEPGYTATDNIDGDITDDVIVTGSVNTAVAGQYSLTYTVTDAAGNVGTRVRVVNVVAEEDASATHLLVAAAQIKPDDRLYVKNDLEIVVTITDDQGSPVVSGGVSVEVYPVVGGAAAPIASIALTHSDEGVWSGVLDASLPLLAGSNYTIEVIASSGGLDGQWVKQLPAVYRRLP